jgi:translation initiation factor IF-3
LEKRLRINNFIRVSEVTVIDETGKQLGVMKILDALKLARERDLDLVEVGPTVQPPIAKIMDYGKYMYQQERLKKAGPKQKDQETKTVRIGFKTGIHDLNVRLKQIHEFLGEGHLVKVELTLRGREKAPQIAEMGRAKLLAFLQTITEPIIMQDQPRRGPYGWVVMIRKDKKASPSK